MNKRTLAVVVSVVSLAVGIAGLGYANRVGATAPTLFQRKQALDTQQLARAATAPRATYHAPTAQARPQAPAGPESMAVAADFPLTKQDPTAATSVWFAGYVPGPNSEWWSPVYVIAWQPQGSQNAVLEEDGLNLTSQQTAEYRMASGAPRSVGTLTITGVSGVRGLVTFKTSSGLTGSFNIETGAWSFS